MAAKRDREVWLNLYSVFCGPTNADEAGALMKRAVRELVRLSGVGFLKDRDRMILERAGAEAPEWSNRPVILTDEASTYSVLVDHHWETSSSYHYLTAGPGSSVPPAEVPSEWARVVERAVALVAALSPDVAVGFGVYEGTDSDPINYATLCSGRIQKLTSWNFVKSDRVDAGLTKVIGSVGEAARTTGSGVILELAPRPGAKPEEKILKQLAAANIAYVDLVIDQR